MRLTTPKTTRSTRRKSACTCTDRGQKSDTSPALSPWLPLHDPLSTFRPQRFKLPRKPIIKDSENRSSKTRPGISARDAQKVGRKNSWQPQKVGVKKSNRLEKVIPLPVRVFRHSVLYRLAKVLLLRRRRDSKGTFSRSPCSSPYERPEDLRTPATINGKGANMEHPKKNTPRAKYPPCSSFLARSGGRIWKPENSGRRDVFLFRLRFFFCRGTSSTIRPKCPRW